MGRLIIVVSFLCCFALALWFSFTRQHTLGSKASTAPVSTKNPIVLDDFVITSYKGATLEQSLAGGNAFFIAADRVMVNGGINWWHNKTDKIGSVRADNATFFLQGDSSADFMLDGQLDHVIFNGHVIITINSYVLHTESATYLPEKNQLVGREKVTLFVAQNVVSGNDGFSFDIEDEVYQLFGDVKGVLVQ